MQGKAGIGINATGADRKVDISVGTKMVAQTVVLKADKGNVAIQVPEGTDPDAETEVVTMGTTLGGKDSNLVVFAGSANGDDDVFTANLGDKKPSSNISIAKATTAPVNSGDIVDLDMFSYKTAAAGGMEITFLGSNIALENTAGAVTVNTTKDITIVNAAGGSGAGSIAAVNVVDSSDSPVTVAAGADAANSPAGLIGTSVTLNTSDGTAITENGVAAGKVTVAEGAQLKATGAALTVKTADDKGIEVQKNAIVESETGSVTLDGSSINVLGGGTVQAANGAVTLTAGTGGATVAGTVQAGGGAVQVTSGDELTVSGTVRDYMVVNGAEQTSNGGVALTSGNGKDAAVSGTVTSRGTTGITAAKDALLSGAVTSGGAATITAGQNVRQTGGTITAYDTLDITATAGDINQTAGSITAVGAATAKAENGSVTLAQAQNDFQNGLDVTAKTSVNVRDKDALTLSVAGDTEGDVRAQAGQTLFVTSDIDAGGAVTLDSGNHMEAKKVTADGAVTATATANGAVFSGAVEGASVALTATGAALETQKVTTQDGNATLTGGSVTTAGDVTANGANSDAAVTATAGTAQVGGTVTAGRGAAITATAGANTTAGAVTEARNATVAAGNGAARVAAMTATAGNAAISGASVNSAGVVQAGGDAALTATAGAVATGAAVTGGRDATITATAGANTTAGAVTAARNATIAAGNGAAQVAAVTATAGNAAISGASVNNADAVQAGGTAALIGSAGGATVDTNVTADGNAVVIADGGAATINATVTAASLGIQGASVENNGTIQGVNQLALVTTGNQAVNLNDASLPTGAQMVGIQTAGNLTINSKHALTFGNVSVGVGGRPPVAANGVASTGGAVDVNAQDDITSSAITGAGGTTVTAQGQQVTVAGNLGQGGVTTVTAGGLQSGTLASGAATTLAVGGAANVGQLAVGGDLNGQVGGQFQTTGGQAGSIGQQGGAFLANGGFQQNGVLGSGAVNVQAANYQMNGALNAGGAAVNIVAPGGIQGNGLLTAGALTLQGGAIGAAGNAFQINSANLQQIAGNGIYIVDTSAGPIAINVINSTGDLDLTIQNAQVAGGGTITAGGNFTLTTSQQFGTLQNPVNVTFGGTLTINGVNAPLLHIVIDGAANPSDLEIVYNANGFAIWGNAQEGYQIVGLGPDKQRLINRALAFTVNTPELKSKQGVFGDPAMIHTKMSVSDARSLANMDMLSLNAVNFRKTWEGIRSKEGSAALRQWGPRVYPNATPLRQKLEAVASEMETQPEIWVPGQESSSDSNGQ